MPKWVGLDLHKEYAHGYEWNTESDVKRHFRIPSDQRAWSKYIENQVDRETCIAVEATGNAFHIYDILAPFAGKVVVADANHLKRYGDGRHHDRNDAKRLAEMLALDTLRPVLVPSPEIRDIRQVLKYRDRVVADKTRCINRARAVLRGDGHNVSRTVDPWKWLEQQETKLSGTARVTMASCLRQREAFEAEIEALATELKRFAVKNSQARQLMSLPGVGPIVAATLVAYIGDPTRFKKAKQVVRYAGLDASVHQSGEEYWQGRISKNGPPLLRKLLVQAAHQIVRCGRGPLAEFYRRKVKEIGSRRAIIAVSRKLLIAAWRLMQTDRLAYELSDEKVRMSYQRSLRALELEVAKADVDISTQTEEALRKPGMEGVESTSEPPAKSRKQSPRRGVSKEPLAPAKVSA